MEIKLRKKTQRIVNVVGSLQSLIPRIYFDYLAEVAQTEGWKDIIYLRHHLDRPVSTCIVGNLVWLPTMFSGCVRSRACVCCHRGRQRLSVYQYFGQLSHEFVINVGHKSNGNTCLGCGIKPRTNAHGRSAQFSTRRQRRDPLLGCKAS